MSEVSEVDKCRGRGNKGRSALGFVQVGRRFGKGDEAIQLGDHSNSGKPCLTVLAELLHKVFEKVLFRSCLDFTSFLNLPDDWDSLGGVVPVVALPDRQFPSPPYPDERTMHTLVPLAFVHLAGALTLAGIWIWKISFPPCALCQNTASLHLFLDQ